MRLHKVEKGCNICGGKGEETVDRALYVPLIEIMPEGNFLGYFLGWMPLEDSGADPILVSRFNTGGVIKWGAYIDANEGSSESFGVLTIQPGVLAAGLTPYQQITSPANVSAYVVEASQVLVKTVQAYLMPHDLGSGRTLIEGDTVIGAHPISVAFEGGAFQQTIFIAITGHRTNRVLMVDELLKYRDHAHVCMMNELLDRVDAITGGLVVSVRETVSRYEKTLEAS